MRHPITALALLTLAAPALAGSAPGFVSSFNIGTSTFAAYGPFTNPIETTSDADPIASFFGSANSSSLLETFDTDGDIVDRATGNSNLTVSGAAQEWTIQAMTSAISGSQLFATRSNAEFLFDAEFWLGAGQEFNLNRTVFQKIDGGDDTLGFNEWDINVYRDDVLIYMSGGGGQSFGTTETLGASYRLEILGGSYSGTSNGPGGRFSLGELTLTVNVSIVPAPMTAAPLAFAGVLAARRRRA